VTNSFDRHKTHRAARKSSEKFIICYTGIFYPAKDPYGFFRGLRNWFDRMDPHAQSRYRDKLEIHLIGSGDRMTRQVIEGLKLEPQVKFFDRMPHEKAIQKTLQADMALICTGTGEKTRPGWLPSKFFEYIGCRIPILALIREGELARMIRATRSGYVLTSEDHLRIAEILQQQIDQKFSDQQLGTVNSTQFLCTHRFEEEYVMDRFLSIIDRVSELR
jgi:glycosyltransferase involved in cell wall biosynthesis